MIGRQGAHWAAVPSSHQAACVSARLPVCAALLHLAVPLSTLAVAADCRTHTPLLAKQNSASPLPAALLSAEAEARGTVGEPSSYYISCLVGPANQSRGASGAPSLLVAVSHSAQGAVGEAPLQACPAYGVAVASRSRRGEKLSSFANMLDMTAGAPTLQVEALESAPDQTVTVKGALCIALCTAVHVARACLQSAA